jgi:hypothetical protein
MSKVFETITFPPRCGEGQTEGQGSSTCVRLAALATFSARGKEQVRKVNPC